MTHLEFTCSDEKATALLKASRLFDEGDDFEPVRHGRWRDDTFCTNCGWFAEDASGHIIMSFTNYCPNCGAKMDGGADND